MSNPRVLMGIVTLALASFIAGCAGSAETREEGSGVEAVRQGPTPTPSDAATPSEIAEEIDATLGSSIPRSIPASATVATPREKIPSLLRR